jgi:dihydroorotase
MNFVIRNASIVNEGKITVADVLLKDGRIERIGTGIPGGHAAEINGEGKTLFPGVIDDQVHFRDPGLTYKGDLFSESRAAVAGGITSFMEMPNTVPNTLTQELLEEKYRMAAARSLANYSFYMGASNDNYDEVMKTNPSEVCGLKIFMGSSTGNMLVDNAQALERLFAGAPLLIAVHCEDEATIRANAERARGEYGDDVPVRLHPVIRSEAACYLSSSFAVGLARRHGTRLHILHLSTARELELFDADIPLAQKRITAEACIHHLWFDDTDYDRLGTFIKWNPAIKTKADREALLRGVLENRIDVIATDHAPHTREEKKQSYFRAPSGGPLVQHALVAMLELVHRGQFPLERIAEKMSHAVADCFRLRDRGYIREGYAADLVLVDLNDPWTVDKTNILAKCGWSPFEGQVFRSRVTHTFVNGQLVYENGKIVEANAARRLLFQRD